MPFADEDGKKRLYFQSIKTSLLTLAFKTLAGIGTSLVVQWLGLLTRNAAGPASIPGWGTRMP